ncbi:MAG: hypothetical protein ACLSHU_07135 [Oscillospiraceae bacterium]
MLPPAAEDQVGVGVHQTGRHQAPACIDVPGPLEQVRRDLAVAQGRDDPSSAARYAPERWEIRPWSGPAAAVRPRGWPEGRCWK